jgi:hypothetical protein
VPKTRSGKILGRAPGANELGQPVGDVSTMDEDWRRRQKTEDRTFGEKGNRSVWRHR